MGDIKIKQKKLKLKSSYSVSPEIRRREKEWKKVERITGNMSLVYVSVKVW